MQLHAVERYQYNCVQLYYAAVCSCAMQLHEAGLPYFLKLLAIETLAELKGAGRAFAILGDMKELGAYEEFAHVEIGRAVVSGKIDFLATVGPMMRYAALEALESGVGADWIEPCKTPEEAAAWTVKRLMPGDWVLVMGSRSMEMERAVEALRG